MILFIITFNKNSYYIILLFLRLETLNNEHSNEITEKSECSKKRKIDYKDDEEVINEKEGTDVEENIDIENAVKKLGDNLKRRIRSNEIQGCDVISSKKYAQKQLNLRLRMQIMVLRN